MTPRAHTHTLPSLAVLAGARLSRFFCAGSVTICDMYQTQTPSNQSSNSQRRAPSARRSLRSKAVQQSSGNQRQLWSVPWKASCVALQYHSIAALNDCTCKIDSNRCSHQIIMSSERAKTSIRPYGRSPRAKSGSRRLHRSNQISPAWIARAYLSRPSVGSPSG